LDADAAEADRVKSGLIMRSLFEADEAVLTRGLSGDLRRRVLAVGGVEEVGGDCGGSSAARARQQRSSIAWVRRWSVKYDMKVCEIYTLNESNENVIEMVGPSKEGFYFAFTPAAAPRGT
jgi:hypothetical protein